MQGMLSGSSTQQQDVLQQLQAEVRALRRRCFRRRRHMRAYSASFAWHQRLEQRGRACFKARVLTRAVQSWSPLPETQRHQGIALRRKLHKVLKERDAALASKAMLQAQVSVREGHGRCRAAVAGTLGAGCGRCPGVRSRLSLPGLGMCQPAAIACAQRTTVQLEQLSEANATTAAAANADAAQQAALNGALLTQLAELCRSIDEEATENDTGAGVAAEQQLDAVCLWVSEVRAAA